MEWARILAYITGMVDQELLLRNGYLVAENRILRSQLKGRLRLTDDERATLGREGASASLLGWYRKLMAKMFDGPQARGKVGRPRIDR